MSVVILMMLAGGVVGFLFRRRRLRFLSAWIMALIWLLLFAMGVEIGGNRMIVDNFASLGLEAAALGVLSTLGSVLLALLLWRCIRKKSAPESHESYACAMDETSSDSLWKSLKSCLYIVLAFVVGLLAGLLNVLPSEWFAGTSIYILYVLMFSVGASIGCDTVTLNNIGHISPGLALLPLMTILGTWLGSLLCSAFLDRSPADCLAVGSGMGYYSLSSVLITEARGADLGAVALLSNVIREILAILAAPLFCRFFGRLAPISAGGCTTADTTLPVITRVCGRDFVVVAVYHGVVVDLTIPFIVSFFCSL